MKSDPPQFKKLALEHTVAVTLRVQADKGELEGGKWKTTSDYRDHLKKVTGFPMIANSTVRRIIRQLGVNPKFALNQRVRGQSNHPQELMLVARVVLELAEALDHKSEGVDTLRRSIAHSENVNGSGG